MPIAHFSKKYAVEDAKIDAITADPSGGATTHGTLFDVPGIKSTEIEGDITTKSLRGDNVEMDTISALDGVTLSVEHAKLHLDILGVLVGGAVVDAGVTPNQTATWTLVNPNFGSWRFRSRTPSNGTDFIGGANLLTAYKCTLSAFPALGQAEEDYKIASFSARCMKRLSDGKHVEEQFQETAIALV